MVSTNLGYDDNFQKAITLLTRVERTYKQKGNQTPSLVKGDEAPKKAVTTRGSQTIIKKPP